MNRKRLNFGQLCPYKDSTGKLRVFEDRVEHSAAHNEYESSWFTNENESAKLLLNEIFDVNL